MNKIQQRLLSPVLAQFKLKFSGSNNNNSGFSSAIITTNNCDNSMRVKPKVSDKPNFHEVREEDKYDDMGLPMSEVISMLARKANSLYEHYLISEHGQELLAKADEFNISYDINNIDFIELRDQVEEFEDIIARASEYDIDWQRFGYDVNGIEQEIVDKLNAESDYMRVARSDFFLSQGLEA